MAKGIDTLKGLLTQRNGLAHSNIFKVMLPSIGDLVSNDIDTMCKAMNLPGRQIATMERVIGPKQEKLPYTFLQDDVTLVFNVTNDYAIQNYFETWMNLVISQDTYELEYKANYAKQISLQPMDKSETGRIKTIILEEAYPTTMNAIEYQSDPNTGFVELGIQLSYYNWRSV